MVTQADTSTLKQFKDLKLLHWLLVLTGLWLVMVWDSLLSAIQVWSVTDSYNHCFFVIPLSLYLIYGQRSKLLSEAPKSIGILGSIPLIAVLLVWMLGFAGNLDALTHIATFILLPLLWAIALGFNASKAILFPLCFILFSIPIGEELIPLFQEVTAYLSVMYLQWSGIPVFREGLFIVIPEGRFVVAEACSGVRFFVSTIMLGSLCAYLLFNSPIKRAGFVMFSIVMPILANSIRAFGIILIGHLSGMEYAVGADHLIYGWFFFAIVTGFLIYVAYRFQEKSVETGATISAIHKGWFKWPNSISIGLIAFVLCVFIAWKVSFEARSSEQYNLAFGNFSETFYRPSHKNAWSPIFPDAGLSKLFSLEKDDLFYDLHVFAYLMPKRDEELISWKNRIYDPDLWTLEASEDVLVEGISYRHIYIVSETGKFRSIAYWYDVPGYLGPSKLKTKLAQSLNALRSAGLDGAVMMLTLEHGEFTQNSSALRELIGARAQEIKSITPW